MKGSHDTHTPWAYLVRCITDAYVKIRQFGLNEVTNHDIKFSLIRAAQDLISYAEKRHDRADDILTFLALVSSTLRPFEDPSQ